MEKKYTIAVAGTGYVGLSIATLLSQHHKVYAVDIVPSKVELINQRKSPIQDEYIEKYLLEKELDLTATLDAEMAYSAADFVVIAAPTNYDSTTQHFDTSAVENVIGLVMQYNPNAIMVIKSTGGGWQDQVGGVVNGIKYITSKPGLNQELKVEHIQISESTKKELDERFCLIYTGQRRLARNLLRDVVGRYVGNEPGSLFALNEIQRVLI